MKARPQRRGPGGGGGVGKGDQTCIQLYLKLSRIFSKLKSDNFIIKIFYKNTLFSLIYKIGEWETDN